MAISALLYGSEGWTPTEPKKDGPETVEMLFIAAVSRY
jgi:hypothetical protein